MSTQKLRIVLVAVAVVASLAVAGPVAAHVGLAAASPAENETVTTPLAEVRLEFSGPLTAGGDHAIGVFGPGETRVDDGQTVEVSDRVVSTPVGAPTEAGAYSVRWLVIGADGHTIEGTYSFTYAGPVPSPSAEPSSPEPAEPTATPVEPVPSPLTAQPTSSGGGGFPLLAVVLIGGVAAGAIAVVALRRRSAPS